MLQALSGLSRPFRLLVAQMSHGIMLLYRFGRTFFSVTFIINDPKFEAKNSLITSSSLEMMVGIICSCFLALPAFIDHYFPQDFAHYMSKISSLFSTKDSSEPPTKYNDRKLHRSKSTAYNHSTGSHGVDEYTELGEEIEPPMNLENLQPHKATSLNTTNVTGGSSNQDTEALALDGIWKTVKVHQSYLIDTKKPDSS